MANGKEAAPWQAAYPPRLHKEILGMRHRQYLEAGGTIKNYTDCIEAGMPSAPEPEEVISWEDLSDIEKQRVLTTENISPSSKGYPPASGYTWEWQYDPTTRTGKWAEVVGEGEPWEVGGFGSEEEWKIAMGTELSPQEKAELEATRWWQEQQIARWGEESALDRERLEWQMGQQGQTTRERGLEWQARLSELTAPSDWIARWTIQNVDIPKSRAQTLKEESRVLLQEAQSLTGAERTMKEMQSEKLRLSAQGMAEKANLAGGPPSPEWLPKFAPSQTAGEPITKGQVVTPSGQQWGATPWSARQGLKGYTEWSGGRGFQDVLEQMAMMQPETPAGRPQWRPARQRV